MRRIRVLTVTLAMLAAAIVSSAPPVAAGSPSLNYPGDCATSIQQCVDLAPDGYTIYVNADDAGPGFSIDSKSLEISSGNGTKYHTGYISVRDGSTPIHATVSGFSVSQFVEATFDSSTGSSVTVRNVSVTAGPGYAGAIAFYAEGATASFTLERSTALATGFQQPALKMAAFGNGANASFHVVGNQFSGHGDPSSGAGIYLQMYDDATVEADILNNTIWDVSRCSCGGASGIEVLANDTVHADVNVVGNTVERAGSAGILVSNNVAAGALLALDLFNNIFAHARGSGIWVIAGVPGTMAFRGGYNDTFGNGSANVYGGLPSGPGNLSVAPKFVNAATGDLRLKSASGLIDKGQVCSPGGVANPDAAGKTRLSGMSVDIGALERGAAAISGAVVLGTNGPDSLLGSGGDDIICGYAGADTLHGYEGGDYLDGGTAGDLLWGDAGPDLLFGRDGADTLCATDAVSGNDLLNGGKGNDGFRADSGDVKMSVEHAASCFV